MKIKAKPIKLKKIKIRVKNGNTHKKNNLNFKRKKIPTIYRMAVIIIFGILAISALYSAVAVESEGPKTIEKSVPKLYYSHNAKFNYIAHLKNNTVYNFNTIMPGQATIFKKITDYFNISFSYDFKCPESTSIAGTYKLIAEIHTEDDLWSRSYTITPSTTFKTNEFNTNFNLNLSTYENIVSAINTEIGITATNPTLTIKCEININSQTPEGGIYETFSPSITLPLTGNIIEIDDSLSQTKTGSLKETVNVKIPEEDVSEERNGSLLLAGIFFLPIIPVYVFTENDNIKLSDLQRQMKKIKKKYGEWIVEVNKLPRRPDGTELVYMKSMDDLIKISEELGKPVVNYKSETEESYAFVIFDEKMHYVYILGNN